jgi:hypothetical protein
MKYIPYIIIGTLVAFVIYTLLKSTKKSKQVIETKPPIQVDNQQELQIEQENLLKAKNIAKGINLAISGVLDLEPSKQTYTVLKGIQELKEIGYTYKDGEVFVVKK